MLGTRGILALLAGAVMTGGIVALRTERDSLGLWLLTAGFLIASLWSGLSVYWSMNNPSVLPTKSHLVLGTTSVTATIYYGVLAKDSITTEN